MDYKKRLAEYDVDDFTLSVDISEQPDLEAAADWAGFKKKPDGWVVFGRHGMESKAREIANRKWKGVRGSTATGSYHVGRDGGYAGLCEVEIAMLFDPRKRAVELFAFPQAFDAFEKVLESFEFLERQNGK